MLRRLLLNVWQNAMRHNVPGGSARIVVRLAEVGPEGPATVAGGGMVEVRVAITGPGIPLWVRDRIFERFFQVDPSRGGRAVGTGWACA